MPEPEVEQHKTEEYPSPDVIVAGKGKSGTFYQYIVKWIHQDKEEPLLKTGHQVTLTFQRGDPLEHGINGLTNEVLIAIIIHRLEGYQSGYFKCQDNDSAIEALQSALYHLLTRAQGDLSKKQKQEAEDNG